MRILSGLFPVLVLMAPVSATADTAAVETNQIDRILVIVNDEIITASEVANRIEAIRTRLRQQSVSPPPEEILRRQVIEHMIVERLQTQLAKQAGIKISDQKLDAAMGKIAERRKLDIDEFKKELAGQRGGLAAARAELRNQLMAQEIAEREVINRIRISDSEIDDFLANRERRGAAVEYNISHILIPVPESASPEKIAESRQQAEQVYQQLENGDDFRQVAIANSKGQNALEGGSLGWRSDGQLPDLFLDGLKGLEPGQFSKVLKSANGFHILKLNDRRGGAAPHRVVQTHARHILIKTSELVTPTEATRRANDLRERLGAGEDFAELARARSEDLGSAANGGDLNWVVPGQTVPQFETAMADLKIGALSRPLRSPFGIHLIQVLERREQDVSRDRERALARNQLMARRSDERMEMWIRQLRDEAFVVIRPEKPASTPKP